MIQHKTAYNAPALDIRPSDHIQGSKDAPVTLMEYGDYQCPYCGMAYPVVKQIQRQMVESMCFVFRNFPLTEVHPFAEGAAEAAEAAGDQGKFWEMHDTLYENQNALAPEDLVGYAQLLHLKRCAQRREWDAHVFHKRCSSRRGERLRNSSGSSPGPSRRRCNFCLTIIHHKNHLPVSTAASLVCRSDTAYAAMGPGRRI
jgi:Thioredoxin